MTDYLTEQEQVQQLKNMIKQYGLPILIGILLAGLIAIGWNYWQERKTHHLVQASVIYDEMLTLRAQNNLNSARVEARKLMHQYPKTPYAEMAALLLARTAVLKKDYTDAIKQLTWVTNHSRNAGIQDIARIRMARIFIANHTPDKALDILQPIKDKSFRPLVDEIRGDAYLAKNDKIAARLAYEKAKNELPNAEELRPILEIKLDNLAVASHPITQR